MPDIEHVVVLMLENRSFDSMLGRLKAKGPAFDGLDGTETNPASLAPGAAQIPVWSHPGSDPASMTIPDPDPGELFAQDVNVQIFGTEAPAAGAEALMQGFVADYARQPGVAPDNINAVIHCYTPDQVPVISRLATAFGVSDRWHAAAPCQTWPNRFFAHTGTAGGYVNNTPLHFPYTMKSVFALLDEAKRSWRVYFHDLPQTALLSNVWEAGIGNFRWYGDEFAEDAAAGKLPAYSFIEPRYFTNVLSGLMPNDQHPPHNVLYGEQLMASVYNAVRSGPNWDRTLLIVTYDEHGGNFDHVPPPAAPSPGGPEPDGFAFDRYGIRVPAIIVSPYVPAGSVIRPPDGSSHPFDHTTIITTLRALFGLSGPLTRRDAAAPDLLHALSLDFPLNPGPERIDPPALQPTAAEIAAAAAREPNGRHRLLSQIAAHLPAAGADVAGHVQALADGTARLEAPVLATMAEAAQFVEGKVKAFLG